MNGSESIALHECKVCGHRWYPRPVRGILREPARCASSECQSTYWKTGKPPEPERKEERPRRKRRRGSARKSE